MAAAVRSFWKGHLRLSLVTIPVRLVSATRADGAVSFHQVDRKTKQRIRYQKVVPGNYVLLEDDELDTLKLETRHTIELTGRQRNAARAYAGARACRPISSTLS